MRMKRRTVVFIAAVAVAAAALGALPCITRAQPNPGKTVKIVVAWPAGGFVDVVTRALGDRCADGCRGLPAQLHG